MCVGRFVWIRWLSRDAEGERLRKARTADCRRTIPSTFHTELANMRRQMNMDEHRSHSRISAHSQRRHVSIDSCISPALTFASLRPCGSLLCVIAALLVLSCANFADAESDEPRTDALFMPGVNIPIANITIERIAAGQVIYRDAGGRRHQRNMDDVGSLRFADLPHLDRAEEYAGRGEYRNAIPHFLQALVDASNDTQRMWIHSRLAPAHDIVGEYAQAASHAAAAFLLEEHIVWRDLEPIREPEGEPSFAAVAEARHMLREAQRRITHRDLSQAVARMSHRIERMHEDVKDADDGTPIRPRTTWSGFPIDRIREGKFDFDDADENEPAEPDASTPAPTPTPAPDRDPAAAPQPETPPADEPRDTERDGRSPDVIERLLDDGRFDEALERCRRIERNLGNRDLAQFLYQYGRALAGKEQFEDAAIMFTRCAILHPASPYAPRALIETAIIYREHYNQPRTALRLLDRAEDMLGGDAPDGLRDRIAKLRNQ